MRSAKRFNYDNVETTVCQEADDTICISQQNFKTRVNVCTLRKCDLSSICRAVSEFLFLLRAKDKCNKQNPVVLFRSEESAFWSDFCGGGYTRHITITATLDAVDPDTSIITINRHEKCRDDHIAEDECVFGFALLDRVHLDFCLCEPKANYVPNTLGTMMQFLDDDTVDSIASMVAKGMSFRAEGAEHYIGIDPLGVRPRNEHGPIEFHGWACSKQAATHAFK